MLHTAVAKDNTQEVSRFTVCFCTHRPDVHFLRRLTACWRFHLPMWMNGISSSKLPSMWQLTREIRWLSFIYWCSYFRVLNKWEHFALWLAQTIVKALIERGADVNAKDRNQWTPLLSACSSGDLNVIDMLLNHPKVDVKVLFSGERICHVYVQWLLFNHYAVS